MVGALVGDGSVGDGMPVVEVVDAVDGGRWLDQEREQVRHWTHGEQTSINCNVPNGITQRCDEGESAAYRDVWKECRLLVFA